MSLDNFNWLDYTFLTIFLMSILIGMRRGLLKEVISIVTWIAAFFIACAFSTKLAAVFSSSSGVVASTVSAAASKIGVDASGAVPTMMVGVSFVVLFVGTLIIGSVINSIMASVTSVPGIGLINLGLGGLFGFMRGYMVILIIMFLVQMTSAAQAVSWSQSQFVQGFQPSVIWLGNIIQPGLQTLKIEVGETLENIGKMGVPGAR